MGELTPAMLVGGAFGGLTAGLIPFFVAQQRGQMSLAWTALIAGIAVGLIGGALFATPVCIVFTVVSLSKPAQPTGTQARLGYWKIAVPATILLWLAAMGAVAYSLPSEYITARITVPIGFFALVIGGWVATLVLRFANRVVDTQTSADLSSKIASLGNVGDHANQPVDREE